MATLGDHMHLGRYVHNTKYLSLKDRVSGALIVGVHGPAIQLLTILQDLIYTSKKFLWVRCNSFCWPAACVVG